MTGTAIVSAQIPLAMRELLARHAAEHERSLSGEIRVALRQHLETSSAPGARRPPTAGRSFAGPGGGPLGAAGTPPRGAVGAGPPEQGSKGSAARPERRVRT